MSHDYNMLTHSWPHLFSSSFFKGVYADLPNITYRLKRRIVSAHVCTEAPRGWVGMMAVNRGTWSGDKWGKMGRSKQTTDRKKEAGL